MNPIWLRYFTIVATSILLVSLAPPATAFSDRDSRDVRIAHVSGDVRISHGDGKHPNLKKSWEEARSGELVEQGFAVATGDGSAEIELEFGSTIYLAKNSLLLFRGLSSRRDDLTTRMALATGTVTVWAQPVTGESIVVETPTDVVEFSGPRTFFLRLDAYLDATALTYEGDGLQPVLRRGMQDIQISKGQTVFLQGGELVSPPGFSAIPLTNIRNCSGYFELQQKDGRIETFRCSETLASPGASASFRGLDSAGGTASPSLANGNPSSSFGRQLSAGSEWDQLVEARVKEKENIMASALKASGLTSPVPGLAELYVDGAFFSCEPYGTCWEPNQQEAEQAIDAQTSSPSAQSPPANASNTEFQPQKVEWMETTYGVCGSYSSRRVSRVANTPAELDELLRLKAQSGYARNQNAFIHSWDSDLCNGQGWIPRHHGFAMVLPKTPTQPCKSGEKCKPVHPRLPVHPPRPVFVRVGGEIGLVPPHPNDIKGKPPINLKYGIIMPPAKPGEPVQRIMRDPSQKLDFISKPTIEFAREFAPRAVPMAAPEIRAHLMQEATRDNSVGAANHADVHIVYNFTTQKFLTPAAAGAGGKAREVAVAGIASNGRIGSFANGQSGRYAEAFGRSSAGASYGGGGNYGSRSSGSGSSGGSSSHSSGSGGYSGSHSSSSGSSGGSYSHSSGGSSGGSSSSSGGGSSSGSSGGSSAGGHSH
jgi:hypothetical protein